MDPTLRGPIEGRVFTFGGGTPVGADSVFVDVEDRVRNSGTTDVSAYEVYVHIENTNDPFFQEVRGEELTATQDDVATVSKCICTEPARTVVIDDLWFEIADS